ncbi:hypothetical protein PMAYCL1PPCAC_21203, partial [Pristionchus mayeri]
ASICSVPSTYSSSKRETFFAPFARSSFVCKTNHSASSPHRREFTWRTMPRLSRKISSPFPHVITSHSCDGSASFIQSKEQISPICMVLR